MVRFSLRFTCGREYGSRSDIAAWRVRLEQSRADTKVIEAFKHRQDGVSRTSTWRIYS